jgi:PAS domain S-box-containing protein
MSLLSFFRPRKVANGEAFDPYRSIFENAIEGIFQTTPSGQYLNVNPALAKMYGYKSKEDLIQHLTRIDAQLYVDPSRREIFVQEMRKYGVVRGFESEIYRKDGSIIWISENARTVLATDGSISYYEGMVEDITKRKRLEENMSRVSRQLHALLESAGEGIFGMDTEGRCTFINRAGAQMLGYFPRVAPRFRRKNAGSSTPFAPTSRVASAMKSFGAPTAPRSPSSTVAFPSSKMASRRARSSRSWTSPSAGARRSRSPSRPSYWTKHRTRSWSAISTGIFFFGTRAPNSSTAGAAATLSDKTPGRFSIPI